MNWQASMGLHQCYTVPMEAVYTLEGVWKLIKDLDCSFYFLKDENGGIVEDCISVALGGNDTYDKTMQTGSSTDMFYLTSI